MGYAAYTYAKLIRGQYDDWLARYYPQQKKLTGLAGDNTLMHAQLARVDAAAGQGMRSATLGMQHQMARYGTARRQNGHDNTLSLRSALAVAGARNGIREAQQDRKMRILTGGAAPVRQQLNSGGNNTGR